MNTRDRMAKALHALVNRRFTFWKGEMVGIDRNITRDEVARAREALAAHDSDMRAERSNATTKGTESALLEMVLDDMDTCVGECRVDYEFKDLSTETVEALKAYAQDQRAGAGSNPVPTGGVAPVAGGSARGGSLTNSQAEQAKKAQPVAAASPELPALPAAGRIGDAWPAVYGYDADDMRAYASEAVAGALAATTPPAALAQPDRDAAIRMWHKHCDGFSALHGTSPSSAVVDAMLEFSAAATPAALAQPLSADATSMQAEEGRGA